MDLIANLSGDAAQRRDARALLQSSGPLLHPLHTKQRGPPRFQGRPPDFAVPPDGTPLPKQTYVTPPNQLILASYPNGRPGALRALQRAPSATHDAATHAAADADTMRVSLSRKTIARPGGLDATWEGGH